MESASERANGRVDVIIVGGGPAGTSCAISLAKAGRKVIVMERSGYEAMRVGETLPPAVRLLLGELGVWERFMRDGHAPSPGIISVWGSSEIYEHDFILNPYGAGWHIDRRRFDEMLALAAEDAGATVCRNVSVNACTQQPSGGWLVKAKRNREPLSFEAGFLVNATGRLASPAGRAGTERIFYDRLVGVFKLLTAKSEEPDRDARTLVEASENGWWYSAFLPLGRLIVAYMTDADQLPKGETHLARHWLSQLAKASHTRRRVEACVQNSELKIVAANSYRRASIKDINYLMAGDAAVAFDPLSAQGIYRALEGGLAAAVSIEKHQGGDQAALKEYEDKVMQGFAVYLRTRADYYEQESRWLQSVFWKRRHLWRSI